MKRLLIGILIIALLTLSGCGDKQQKDLSESQKVTPDPINGRSTMVTVPVPESNNSVEWECGIYYSDISFENMGGYLQKLIKDGWSGIDGEDISPEASTGTTQYTLAKDDKLLQIMMIVTDQDNPFANSILVRTDFGLSIDGIQNREGVIPKEKILEYIQYLADDMVVRELLPEIRGKVTGLFEIFIPEAFEKMGLQAFAAISDHGFVGCFLIRENLRAYVPGDLKNACVVDIDQDGKYELMDLCMTWDKGIYKIDLSAYEYFNPVYFSSLTEILQKKYYNCIVPENGYEELQLEKVDENTVKLIGEGTEYGELTIKDKKLVVKGDVEFPYVEWSTAYDQSLLLRIDKEIPVTPPEIIIDVDGLSLDYIVHEDKWLEEQGGISASAAFHRIMEKDQFIPTIHVESIASDNPHTITINFGNSIPDSIDVTDAMMEDNGSVRYGVRNIIDQAVEILDNSRVRFKFQQHFAYYLSSNMNDYNRNWYRLFRIKCKWLEKECTYAFVINTGIEEVLDY